MRLASLTRKTVQSPSGWNSDRLCKLTQAGDMREQGGAATKAALSSNLNSCPFPTLCILLFLILDLLISIFFSHSYRDSFVMLCCSGPFTYKDLKEFTVLYLRIPKVYQRDPKGNKIRITNNDQARLSSRDAIWSRILHPDSDVTSWVLQIRISNPALL